MKDRRHESVSLDTAEPTPLCLASLSYTILLTKLVFTESFDVPPGRLHISFFKKYILLTTTKKVAQAKQTQTCHFFLNALDDNGYLFSY
jgi:hypothetical protein